MKIIPALVILFVVGGVHTSHHMHPLSDEFIDFINSKQNSWRAGRNFPRNTPMKYLKRLAGTLKEHVTNPENIGGKPPNYKKKDLAESFDARLNWKDCPTLWNIRDQGSCGSCWAVAAVSAMTDRLCIQSNGTKNHYFSAMDVMTCCFNNCGNPCKVGGYEGAAWRFAVNKGIVSGGNYDSSMGCKPYEIPPCNHTKGYNSNKVPCGHETFDVECKSSCQKSYKIKYDNDKVKIKNHYALSNMVEIMLDIQNNGPVSTSFNVFQDFYMYKEGVYRYNHGSWVGIHSVKLLGWGKENKTKYWLAANSWNSDWGDSGFFKIIRGINHLGIERRAYAGLIRI
ncbi:cathepsin B-like [Ostrinia nubilalis]|uniref:cathepsin B-like n=1 Tax=Ostrinia nubilalis TaxID=29057 RepID=UPI0030823328